MNTKKVDEIAVKAWTTAVECGGDPDEWRGLLGLTWEDLVYHADPTAVARAMINKYKENMLAFLPEQIRPFVVITTPKHRPSAGTGSTASGTGSTATGSRGKAYQPKLDAYTWTYRGKIASIRRQGDGWAAEYDGQSLGVHASHTQAVEAVYRHNGVTAALNAVKLARMREQDAAAG